MRRMLRAMERFWRGEDSGQALVEFAVAIPLQLFLVFGLMQFAFLYVSTVVVNYTAFRCARAAIVGEHENYELGQFVIHDQATGAEEAGDLYKGGDLIAAAMLAPLTGSHLSSSATRPPKVDIPGWGEINRSDIAAWKSRVQIDEEFDGDGELEYVTAVVEFNQELVFPFVDSLFRFMLPRAEQVDPSEIADLDRRHVFGDVDEQYAALRYGDLNRIGSGRGRIRIIAGRTHYVITRECTLNARMGWRPDPEE